MTTQYRAVIDGSGGDDVVFDAADDVAAKAYARKWCQEGSWGPEPDTVRVYIGERGEAPHLTIEVEVGGESR